MIKLYFKIVRDHKKTILTYIIVFMAIFSIFGMFSDQLPGSGSANYEQKKPDISVMDKDQSELSKVLVAQLNKDYNVIDLGTDINDNKDGLFFAQIDCIVEIPKNFEKEFATGKENLLHLQERPEDATGVLIKQNINSYLSSMSSYLRIDTSLSYQQAGKLVAKDLDKKTNVQFQKTVERQKEDVLRNLYYNFLSYILFSVLVMTAAMAMHSIYRSEMRKRCLISPMNQLRMNIEILISNMLFGIILWAAFTGVIFLIRGDSMFTQAGLIYILNSFVYTLICISFAYMATAIVSNKKKAHDKLDMITTIVGLATSFIGGAFLPLSFIPENILQVSRFIPTYWYVKLNDSLATMSDITSKATEQMIESFGIQFLFMAAFLAIGLLVMKNNRSQDQMIDNDFE